MKLGKEGVIVSFALLPTPRSFERGEGQISVGPASPVSMAKEVDVAAHEAIALFLRSGSGSEPVALRFDPAVPGEGCRLEVSARGVELTASEAAGWRYGIERLCQLSVNGSLRACRMTDQPSLKMRGWHLNFMIRSVGYEEAVRLLDSMARWRLNTVLIEYEDRYPYDGKHRALASPDALSREEVRRLVAHARERHIEVIPLHQCLGHVNHILKHEAYAHLREEEQHRDQWCPMKPESLVLFKECVDDMLALHPGVRFFHMGGDETRRLGACPRCAGAVRTAGKGRLYADFVTQAAAYLLERGVTPIVWDDMLCAHPEALERMPREVAIMYWDYWTVRDPSAVWVARPQNGLGVVADRRWKGAWHAELGEVERRVVDHFSRPTDFEAELSPEVRARFAPYLGPDFPKRIRAFPYLEYYQDKGFRVIGGAAGGSNSSDWHGLPDWPRYGDNIRVYARRIREAAAMGLVTTAWYNMPPEALVPGIMATGQFGWNAGAGGDG